MAETCIVCLGDLRHHTAEDPPPDAAEDAAAEAANHQGSAKKSTRAAAKSIDDDEESIAHILPCKHDLHHACLKPWIERANSCPICRATFNMVQISQAVGGPVVDSYAVQDKVQEAELDPSMIVEEDELFAVEAWDPCVVCGDTDETHEMMYCDGCPKAIHVFCAGFDEAPEIWYCETCLADIEADTGLQGLATAVRRQPRRRVQNRGPNPRRRGRNNDSVWAQVWTAVSRRLDLDLDFPYDDEPLIEHPPQRRRQWHDRIEVARAQGVATERLRDIAAQRLDPREERQPESQEEIRAWNAFDKARESHEAPPNARRRKRKATASPASPHEPQQDEQSQLKRPRLRRRPDAPEAATVAESSNAAVQRNNDDRSTFLSSLLNDVEKKPMAAASPSTFTGQWSPRNSSPAVSPISSPQVTPRAMSLTPPPPQQPLSPPLSTSLMPASSPEGAIFSPFSPTSARQAHHQTTGLHHRGRHREPLERRGSDAASAGRAGSSSPSRALSYSAKQEIQRMVKLALAPRYREKEVSKDQYTDINRDVSRRMYELIGDASALADQAEREKWQGVAEEEVKHAISTLHFGDTSESS